MNPQWQQAAELMAAGMGVVFLFLTLLVLSVLALSATLRRWTPAEPASRAPEPDDASMRVAAIAAALHHRRRPPR